MVKIQTTFQLPCETLRTLDYMKDSLMKSKNWIVEKAIYDFGGKVNEFLAVEEEFREYLRIKKDSWKDDIRNDMLKYHLSKGFMLKNGIRKIIEMIDANVKHEYIEKSVLAYERLCTDIEYKKILNGIKMGILNKEQFDITEIKRRINRMDNSRIGGNR